MEAPQGEIRGSTRRSPEKLANYASFRFGLLVNMTPGIPTFLDHSHDPPRKVSRRGWKNMHGGRSDEGRP